MVKKIGLLFLLTVLSANAANAMTVNDFVENYVGKITDAIAAFIFTPISIFGAQVPIIILWILFAGIFFTFYLRGIPIWGFKHSLKVISEAKKDNGGDGEVSAFQALSTALSGTIGMGSIAGVAIAISIGGKPSCSNFGATELMVRNAAA